MYKKIYKIIDFYIKNSIMLIMESEFDKQGDFSKTHKIPPLAKLQGSYGITVAKVGEAEVMAQQGLNDIFIANEIVGIHKLEKVKILNWNINIRVGVDNR